MPTFRQLFIAGADGRRAPASSSTAGRSSCASASSTRSSSGDGRRRASTSRACPARTFVYKGMLTTPQLRRVLPRPAGRAARVSALALVHSRFSTNTFPSWPLAHPFRLRRPQRRDQHRHGQRELDAGPRGAARHRRLRRPGRRSSEIFPICTPGASDTARFDEVLELLHLGGRSLPHAVLMMIPEAWENHESMDPARRAFYRVPRLADGAVGRPGLDLLHRRHRHRRRARPQRPAPVALSGSPTTASS